MNADSIILKSIVIKSSPMKVWEALTNPEIIKQYFTGAQTISKWEIGSEIFFVHVYEGKEFTNKGIILDFNPNKLLSYTYWTAFSKTEDKPENYTTITYTLTEINDQTTLTLEQTNFRNVEWYQDLQVGWNTVLAKIKQIVEE